jgi:glutathione S-transferase
LSITEYLAERHPEVWPAAGSVRAWARSASAEMHSGFSVLRNACAMNCGIRVTLESIDVPLGRDLHRLEELWADGIGQFGGPFLTGKQFCAVDAFFAPVAFRVQSYALPLNSGAQRYVAQLLALPAMQDWYGAALKETWRDEEHEAEARAAGALRADLRTG